MLCRDGGWKPLTAVMVTDMPDFSRAPKARTKLNADMPPPYVLSACTVPCWLASDPLAPMQGEHERGSTEYAHTCIYRPGSHFYASMSRRCEGEGTSAC